MDVILLGPPGVGKGTQAGALAEWFGLVHLAAGDLLRRQVREGTELGRQVYACMERGELVSDELVTDVVLRRALAPECPGVLLDGFPRTVPQARALDTELAAHDRRVDAVVLLTAPDATLLRRIGGRLTCRGCGATFHRSARPPARADRCDECGGELRGRSDDDARTARRRLDVYRRQTMPLIGYYRTRGGLLPVDADAAPDVVEERIIDAFAELGLRQPVGDRR